MICPLLTLACQDKTPGGAPLHDCLEGECAWWDGEEDACSFACLAAYIRQLRHDILVAARIEAPDD